MPGTTARRRRPGQGSSSTPFQDWRLLSRDRAGTVVRHEPMVRLSDAASIGENTHPPPHFSKVEVKVFCL